MTNKNLQPKTYNPASSAGKPQPRLIGGRAKKGFVMLFSVLISSMLVVIGLSIFNITLKELTISTSGRESQVAFYAANSGIECALYWNLKGNGSRSAFASTTAQEEIDSAKTVPAVCNAVTVNSATSATTNFTFYVNDPSDLNGPCVDVVVVKTPGVPSLGKLTTLIESRGRNICGTVGRRVERGLKATIITDM